MAVKMCSDVLRCFKNVAEMHWVNQLIVKSMPFLPMYISYFVYSSFFYIPFFHFLFIVKFYFHFTPNISFGSCDMNSWQIFCEYSLPTCIWFLTLLLCRCFRSSTIGHKQVWFLQHFRWPTSMPLMWHHIGFSKTLFVGSLAFLDFMICCSPRMNIFIFRGPVHHWVKQCVF